MKNKNVPAAMALLLLVTILFSACVVNNPGTPESPATTESAPTEETTEATAESGSTDATSEAVAPDPAEDVFPEILVLHPDATDVEITTATNTYVYIVPLMVADTLEYLETELTALGWEEMGKPTVMGHLATLNLQREGHRLNVSMQDNERSMTTRVQMILLEQ